MRAVRLLLLAAPVVLAACGGSAPDSSAETPATIVDPATAGRISGRVRFDGAPPPDETVRIDGDRECVTLNGSDRQPSGALVPGADGGLQHVFVHVKEGVPGARFAVPNEPVVIDQQKCRYVPRVVGVQVGQPLQIRNGDPLLHNVRSDPAVNQPFNQGQPVQGMAYTHTFTTREVMVPIKCDVHAWMRAYVGAIEHPYFAVTDERGAFTLPDLPPGTYTLEAWHERLGTQQQPISLGAKERKHVELTFAR